MDVEYSKVVSVKAAIFQDSLIDGNTGIDLMSILDASLLKRSNL